jgi:hypothetical protein
MGSGSNKVRSFLSQKIVKWKPCYFGAIVELLDLNKEQVRVNKYDISPLYPFVMMSGEFPVGGPIERKDVPVSELPNLFGLIKASVYNDKGFCPGFVRLARYTYQEG